MNKMYRYVHNGSKCILKAYNATTPSMDFSKVIIVAKLNNNIYSCVPLVMRLNEK